MMKGVTIYRAWDWQNNDRGYEVGGFSYCYLQHEEAVKILEAAGCITRYGHNIHMTERGLHALGTTAIDTYITKKQSWIDFCSKKLQSHNDWWTSAIIHDIKRTPHMRKRHRQILRYWQEYLTKTDQQISRAEMEREKSWQQKKN
jgi:hypothetical protein